MRQAANSTPPTTRTRDAWAAVGLPLGVMLGTLAYCAATGTPMAQAVVRLAGLVMLGSLAVGAAGLVAYLLVRLLR